MTKAENRAAARAWHEERERARREAAHAEAIKADLAELGRLRNYLIQGRPVGDARPLIDAIDDYVGVITGDRTVLHSQASSIGPRT